MGVEGCAGRRGSPNHESCFHSSRDDQYGMARDIEQTPGYRGDMKMRMPRATYGDDVSELLIGETLQFHNGVAFAMIKRPQTPASFSSSVNWLSSAVAYASKSIGTRPAG